MSTKAEAKPAKPAKQASSVGMTLLHVVGALLVLVLSLASASYVITETWDFGGLSDHAVTAYRRAFPSVDSKLAVAPASDDAGQPALRVFTPEELAQYDGSDPNKPVYLAILGKVYDVTAGRSYYGKGGSYSFFSGKDATRAYITGCFDKDLTHDLRGLTDLEIKTLSTWTDFYEKHKKYFVVGRVNNPPIDPNSPIPEPCGG